MNNLSRRSFLQSTAAIASAPFAASLGLKGAHAAPKPKRPNIILIMADDMGFSDLGCYGSEIPTPNLDRLAASGLRFTEFCNTPRCCPSRAALLTGIYSHQAGVGHMVQDYGKPGYRGFLNDQCVTVAEALRPAGYHPLMVGKWHVGEKHPHWPVDRGFEHYFGLIAGSDSYFQPQRQMALDNEGWHPTDPQFYMTDAFGDHAVGFIKNYSAKPDPYLLYVAFTAPHWPLHAWPDDIAKYRGKYMKGWDVLRQERHERQLAAGILDAKWPLTPRDEVVPAWKTIGNKEDWDLRMAVYAAQVDRLDRNIGRILDQVKASGEEENTLIMFLADNGGCAEENIGGEVYGVSAGPAQSFTSYRRPWANLSNTPFRLYKHWVHEGGISSPFIASWPSVIKQHNALHHGRAHMIDIMATVLDAAGGAYPSTFQGRAIHPLEGKSLLPTFQGRPRELHEAIYWEHEGNRAIKQGDWKLVSRYPDSWSLFNLAEDRTELRDRSLEEQSRVRDMAALWNAWAQRSNVLPWEELHQPNL
jgi:arylsulfatase A-like enzyme